jgi:hypothetical protein
MNGVAIVRVINEPRWLAELREQCSKRTQTSVADQIGYSTAVVNQILKGTYKGSLTAVEKAVRGAFLGETVSCPVMGELEAHRCNEYQRLPYSSSSKQRVMLYRACHNNCPNNSVNKKR